LAPQFPTAGLEALRDALEQNDPMLIQGATTNPPPMICVQNWPVKGACVIGYCGWKGLALETVAEVEEFFARVCFGADRALRDPAAVQWFLNWADDTPRSEVRRLLFDEVERTLAMRSLTMVA
jgi:hypothetical protein